MSKKKLFIHFLILKKKSSNTCFNLTFINNTHSERKARMFSWCPTVTRDE